MKDTYYIVCHKFIHQKVKHNPTEFIHVFSSPTLAFVILDTFVKISSLFAQIREK